MASPSSSRNADPVIVAGGGIGGLAAALALARKGFRSVVLEQAPQFGEIGAGIQIAPNAWHALDALGVGQLVKKEAVFIEHLLMFDGVSGEKVIDMPLDARFARRFRNSSTCARARASPATATTASVCACRPRTASSKARRSLAPTAASR